MTGNAQSISVTTDFEDVPYRIHGASRSRSLPHVSLEIHSPRNLQLQLNPPGLPVRLLCDCGPALGDRGPARILHTTLRLREFLLLFLFNNYKVAAVVEHLHLLHGYDAGSHASIDTCMSNIARTSAYH